jgi:hypothetical protein
MGIEMTNLQYSKGEDLSQPLLATVEASAEIYRKRLIKISWFIGNLNEKIASSQPRR